MPLRDLGAAGLPGKALAIYEPASGLILDAVLEDYVEDAHSVERIARDRGIDLEVVRRVVRMVDRAEYKRQQSAPGIKISAKAFGYGRRLPIAAKSEV